MNKDKKEIKKGKLEFSTFSTYCIFTKDKQSVEETIGLIFKDYIENMKIKDKK